MRTKEHDKRLARIARDVNKGRELRAMADARTIDRSVACAAKEPILERQKNNREK
jgi:hypothetical protein